MDKSTKDSSPDYSITLDPSIGANEEGVAKEEILKTALITQGYDSFNAHIILSDTVVYGYACILLDESTLKSNLDDSIYIQVAFITDYSFPTGSENEGYQVFPDEFQYVVENYHYVWTSKINLSKIQYAVSNHFITLEVNDSKISITEKKLEHDVNDYVQYIEEISKLYDESKPIYSFDLSKQLFNPENFEYTGIVGQPLYSDFDYKLIVDELNRIISEQSRNFSKETVTTIYQISQNAYRQFLSNLVEPTFCGYSVEELRSAVDKLEANEVLTLGPKGYYVFTFEEPPPTAGFGEWLVGITLGIMAAAAIVASVAISFTPGIGPVLGMAAMGAITGFCSNISIQLAEGKLLSELDWAAAAIDGVISAVAGCIPVRGMFGQIASDFAENLVYDTIDSVRQGVPLGEALVPSLGDLIAFTSGEGLTVVGAVALKKLVGMGHSIRMSDTIYAPLSSNVDDDAAKMVYLANKNKNWDIKKTVVKSAETKCQKIKYVEHYTTETYYEADSKYFSAMDYRQMDAKFKSTENLYMSEIKNDKIKSYLPHYDNEVIKTKSGIMGKPSSTSPWHRYYNDGFINGEKVSRQWYGNEDGTIEFGVSFVLGWTSTS